MSEIVVFISYSHDSDAHRERVRGLAASLSRDGCDCRLDVYKDTDEDWPTWMTRQLLEADFVLCVVTETYERRFRDKELPDQGLGVGWEAGLIRRLLYAKKLHNDRIFPVLFEKPDREHIPLELQGYDSFLLDGNAGYEALLRKVLNRPLYAKPATGTTPDLGTSMTTPLFDRPEGAATPAGGTARADISRILKYAPAQLIGREDELQLLDNAWAKVAAGEQGRPHVLTFVALGGEGKTALVAKWAAELAGQDWPGCDAAFAWSFYSQGTHEQQAASSDLFLKEALTFFAEGDPLEQDIKAFAAGPAGAFEKGQRLARLAGQRRSLLILDGLEPLQYAPAAPTAGELKDQGIAALLKGLAASSAGLCVITTRYSLPDLKAFWQTTAPEAPLLRLSRAAGVHLLKTLGVQGSELRNLPSGDGPEQVNEFEKLVEDVKSHALTLTLLGSYLRDAHAGDIRRCDLVKLEEADAEEQGGHAFHVMAAYERAFVTEGDKGQRAVAILRLLGLFDRPMTADCFEALLKPPAIPGLTDPLFEAEKKQLGLKVEYRPLEATKLNLALARLESARLITTHADDSANRQSQIVNRKSVDAHPLLREYFARQLRAQQPDAWRAAHRRLYEHLCATTPDKPQPTLEDLQPLYQAVAHGCQAGLQQETRAKVYRDRILRGTGGDGFHSFRKLGALGSDLGAIACFFEQPWSRISPALSEADQAWLLNEAATRLRALGRLTEALEPMRVSGEMDVKVERWQGAAISYSNLSELELTLGEVAGALGDAAQAVTYADRSGDAFLRMVARAKLGLILHNAGRRAEAETRFREAEDMQKQRQPAYPLLYSLQGFNYCDLLLAAAERAAWQQMQKSEISGQKSELLSACRAVAQRAAQTLKESEAYPDTSLLDFALDHLTLGRAALYAAILTQSAIGTGQSEIDQAVAGLRRSGDKDIIPGALLTRAWLRCLDGVRTGPDSAQADLDEAWDIAERGPMRLFLADIHLYRARLLFREERYPWQSPHQDLAAAARLIEQCGYGRRKEELADAQAAIGQARSQPR